MADFQAGQGAYLRRDYATAMKEWRPLAENGDAESQFNVGLMCAQGRGVPQDDQEMAKWFKMAADQGLAEARFIYGSICANGNGVPQDYVQAYRWFTLAANQGHENAKKLRELVAQQMTPAQIAEAEALAED